MWGARVRAPFGRFANHSYRILAEMLEVVSKRAQVLLATQSVTLLNNFVPQNVIVAENDGLKTTFSRLDEENL